MSNPSWLKNAMIYNVYPQSFYDTNGDGIGDLPGVEQKLDYIQSLGCNIVWMNPIFVSPFRDAGYDVTDFYTVAPRYGSNEDLRRLCAAARERGMHIVLDLVAGHTSLECEWFQRSAEYEENAYSHRYIWTDSVGDLGDGTFINGYSERNGSFMKNYYYCQPALNYGFAHPDPAKPWQRPVEDPACRATADALLDVMSHWVAHGVDGFRVDMAFSLVKGDPDESATVALWQSLSRRFKERHPECLLISEWSYPERALAAGFDIDFLLQFNLKPFTTLFRHEKGKNDRDNWIGPSYFRREGQGDFNLFAKEFGEQLEKTRGLGYLSVPTGTHDLSRVSWGRDEEELRVIFAFLFTLPGIPLLYYGDEIGMRYLPGHRSVEGAYARTGSRSPMQWGEGPNHGFSTAEKTYIPTDPAADAPTVAAQQADPDSLWHHVQGMAVLRHAHPALQEDGSFTVLQAGYPALYERQAGEERIRVLIQPADRPARVEGVNPAAVLAARGVTLADGAAEIAGPGYLIWQV